MANNGLSVNFINTVQGYLNNEWITNYDAMNENLYPGASAYEAETGGLPANLRNSTSNLKVRRYHEAVYTPSNFNLIISGGITQDRVFEVYFICND